MKTLVTLCCIFALFSAPVYAVANASIISAGEVNGRLAVATSCEGTDASMMVLFTDSEFNVLSYYNVFVTCPGEDAKTFPIPERAAHAEINLVVTDSTDHTADSAPAFVTF